mgnify:FL=1
MTTLETSPYRMIVYRDGAVDLPDGRGADEEAGEVFMAHWGKKRAGALLDGREHKEFPT